MTTILPTPLQPGDVIGVIAPASAAKRKFCQAGLEYLRNHGYQVKIAPNLTRGKFFLAGADDLRLKYLQEFLEDESLQGIICVRGGYGTIRIVDRLDYQRLTKIRPKVLVGYSDITALQLALLQKLGWVTYSGPMVASEMGQNISTFSAEWLWQLITAHPYPIELQNPEGEALQVWQPGAAEGRLIGGCLSLITPLLGTPLMPDLQGAILFIEDIGEKTYHLDKHLQILRLHGVFDQIAGLVVGRFTDCFPKNPKRSYTLTDYLTHVLRGYRFPVILNLAYGHLRERVTLPIGVRVRINTDPPSITLLGL